MKYIDREEKKYIFTTMTYMKFTILVHPSLVIITIHLVFLSMPGSREEDFKKIMHLYDDALAQEPLPQGSWLLHTWFVWSLTGSREEYF